MLRTLEVAGFVHAQWEPSNLGPPRRVYDLSVEGEIATDDAYVELIAARDHLDQALMGAKVER